MAYLLLYATAKGFVDAVNLKARKGANASYNYIYIYVYTYIHIYIYLYINIIQIYQQI